MYTDFEKFAMGRGVSSLTLHDYKSQINNALISPNIVEERTGNPLQIDVFSKLFTSRILFLGTEIDSDVANIINSQLLYLQMDNKNAPINLYLNTPGGSVYAGLSIYDTMNYVECPVYTTCLGLAASMGSILLTAGEKGNRAALPHSRVLIHQPLGGVSGQASDIEIVNNEIQTLKKELFTILSEHSGNDYDKLVAMGDRDKWLTAQEAVDLGFIDKVITRE
jgi:ATP-dependent Clp protease protease subunit